MLHASVDKRCKLIRKIADTRIVVSATTAFKELLDLSYTIRGAVADRGVLALNGKAS